MEIETISSKQLLCKSGNLSTLKAQVGSSDVYTLLQNNFPPLSAPGRKWHIVSPSPRHFEISLCGHRFIWVEIALNFISVMSERGKTSIYTTCIYVLEKEIKNGPCSESLWWTRFNIFCVTLSCFNLLYCHYEDYSGKNTCRISTERWFKKLGCILTCWAVSTQNSVFFVTYHWVHKPYSGLTQRLGLFLSDPKLGLQFASIFRLVMYTHLCIQPF